MTLPNIAKYGGLKKDLVAGLTVAVMIIPQGMAYALLAGLPAIYGLYAAFVPLIVYPFFGSSRQLSVGPVALVSIIVLAGISQWADPGTPEFIELALLTSLVAGMIQLLLSALRMGFLVNFLSEPVIAGFTTAAALIIALSQLKYFLGIDIGQSSNVIGIIKGLSGGLRETHWPSAIIGSLTILCIYLSRRISRKIPGALIAVALGTLAVYLWHLDIDGVNIVGEVPRGLPKPTFSFIRMEHILQVLPLALVICLISFIESLAIAKTIATRHDNYPIDANRELLGLGMAKSIGSFFLAFPNTGSFTRSAINDEAGSQSGYSSISAALFLAIILLFLTPLFYYLPKPVLGAIVIAAVFGLINIKEARRLFVISRRDFSVFAVTGILTLLLGIQEGVFVGIILSLTLILQQTSSPHYAILGQLPGTNSFRNINRYPEAKTIPGVLILRYDESIYFANANHFYDTITDIISTHTDIHTVILNCTSIINIDTTGIKVFYQLLDRLDRSNITLLVTHLRGPVRDLFVRSGLDQRIGERNSYLRINDAIESHFNDHGKGDLSRKYAAQINKNKKRFS